MTEHLLRSAVAAVCGAALAGCTVPWPVASRVAGVYPHPERYGATALPHGLDARAPGATCGTCHPPAACAACHPSYPHAFEPGRVHPAVGTQDDACTACHADPTGLIADELPCTACHASYPHPTGWADAGVHGTYALARGGPVPVCGNCHGASLTGGETAVACDDCHTIWPHPQDFDHGSAAKLDPASCAGCHGAEGDGGPVGVPCTTCHLGFPHPATFVEGHPAVVEQRGGATCALCHVAGDAPADMPSPCGAGCHGGKP